MRDIVTLLKLLKEEVEEDGICWQQGGCMCITTCFMWVNEDISKKEEETIDNYLNEHKPKDAMNNSNFWYKMREREPRIEYLDNQIEYELDVIRDRRI